jgi:hypothetical protein
LDIRSGLSSSTSLDPSGEHKKQNKDSREETSETRELPRLDRYNHIDDEETESLDQLTRYFATPIEKVDNPIVW